MKHMNEMNVAILVRIGVVYGNGLKLFRNDFISELI